MTLEQFEINNKLVQLDSNYVTKIDFYTNATGTYKINQENISDIVGLITLGMGSPLGVLANGNLTLINHTFEELKTLLEEIRVYRSALKINRFTKMAQLSALIDIDQILAFDVTL